MPFRFAVGPVLRFERLMTSRRWQVYAARGLFVGVLLAGLAVVWWTEVADENLTTFTELAAVGSRFCEVIVGTQFALVLMVAPAALAGAVCVEKSRGTLDHLLITDLTATEIVLGKLIARLVPVLGFLACSLPVIALGGLLGGVDPLGLVRAYLVLAGLSVLGSALALAFSVWASKPYEALLATYSVWAIWLLTPRFFRHVTMISPPVWLAAIDPLAQAFSAGPGLHDALVFVLFCTLASAVLAAVAISRLRAVAVRQSSHNAAKTRTRRESTPRRPMLGGWFGPSLDGNPVLWREWHRNRPTRWIRVLWGVFALFAAGATGTAIFVNLNGSSSAMLEAWVNGLQSSIGFLLLAVVVANSLAEERAGGSLDVLLATPLSSWSIVWGKWWGGYRLVPRLAILPGLLAFVLWFQRPTTAPELYLIVGLILAYGAAITSLGVALATWITRPTRVLVVAVAVHVLITVGWFFLIVAVVPPSSGHGLAMASPFFGTGMLTALMVERGGPWQAQCRAGALVWIVVYTLAALLLYVATLVTFDRCLGRVPETPRARRRGAVERLDLCHTYVTGPR